MKKVVFQIVMALLGSLATWLLSSLVVKMLYNVGFESHAFTAFGLILIIAGIALMIFQKVPGFVIYGIFLILFSMKYLGPIAEIIPEPYKVELSSGEG